MKKITASIKLAPGNRGFFDPITGINLSLSNSMGYIREDDDITNKLINNMIELLEELEKSYKDNIKIIRR